MFISFPWLQNSIRHSLSLGKYFRKVQSASFLEMQKGFLWEFIPQNKAAIMAEVERFLKQEVKDSFSGELHVLYKSTCTHVCM